MARRKKAHRKHTTHRRRSSIGKKPGELDIMGLALVVAGAIGGKMLASKLETSTNSMFVKVAPFAPLLLGIAIPMFVENPMLKQVSLGLVASGGIEALGANGLKVISGMEVIGYPGDMSLPYRPLAAVSGAAGDQGLAAGTRSNFSGSRMSQINTIAGVAVGDV